MSDLISKAIEIMGTQARLAEACGVTQPAISYALSTGRVSAELAAKIDRATEGKVSREALRPDVFSPGFPDHEAAQ